MTEPNQDDKQPLGIPYPPGNSLYHCLDHLLARPMFWLSVIFLMAMAGVLHRHVEWYWFSIPVGPEEQLEAGILPDSLKKAFQDHKNPLPANITISVVEEGFAWRIDTDKRQYVIRKTDEESEFLFVFNVNDIEARIIVAVLLLLWPIFIAEALLRFLMRSRQLSFWRRVGLLILNVVLPPTRMGAKSYLDTHLLWLPFIGWNHVDKHLRRRLEKTFSVPMILIALMVLPILGLQFIWIETVRQNILLQLLLDAGSAIIWFAFALELTIMLSVARKKFEYCRQHWIDVAVVCLPLIHFMPLLRTLYIARMISLQRLSHLGRLYRLRGLLMRAWRAVVVLEVINRMLMSNPERRLRQLRELIAAKEEELEELRKEVELLEETIAAKEEVKVEE